MKKGKKIRSIVLLCGVAIGTCLSAHAQTENPCEKLLQDGLYSEFRMTNTKNFNQDFRSYLLSDKFRQDLRNDKWGASITVPIEGAPVSIGANAEDKELNTFKERVLQDTKFSVSSSDYQTISSSIPNVEFGRNYTTCVLGTQKIFGFKVDARTGSDWASFDVTYIPQISPDPMPIVQTLEVRNGTNVLTALRVGQKIENSNLVTANRDPKRDLILFLQTDRGSATYKIPGQPTAEFSRDMPVGTIVSSFFDPAQFYQASKSNENNPGGIWMASASRWCPADGRIVPGSLFEKIASQSRVPDLRGMFMRGLNTMEPTPQVALDGSKRDPDDRAVGSYQADLFKKHDHLLTDPGHVHPFDTRAARQGTQGNSPVASDNQGQVAGSGVGGKLSGISIASAGEAESRPKNIAVYYYVRIN